jgi:GntR family transcriptional regulator, transcriptional repressor for pyruvate dehydrogenase complex
MAVTVSKPPRAQPERAAMDALKAVELPSAIDVVLEQVLGLIANGVLKPGDQLPSETELARRLRVGRSTIREVKQILGARGLVEFKGTRGCFVAAADPATADSDALALALHHGTEEHLDEARRILEAGVIRLAATRMNKEKIADLTAALDKLERVMDSPATFWPGTIDFHVRLVAATENPILEKLYALVTTATVTEQLQDYRTLSDPREVLAIHRSLLAAVASGDPDLAEEEMVRHLDESHHKVEKARR